MHAIPYNVPETFLPCMIMRAKAGTKVQNRSVNQYTRHDKKRQNPKTWICLSGAVLKKQHTSTVTLPNRAARMVHMIGMKIYMASCMVSDPLKCICFIACMYALTTKLRECDTDKFALIINGSQEQGPTYAVGVRVGVSRGEWGCWCPAGLLQWWNWRWP